MSFKASDVLLPAIQQGIENMIAAGAWLLSKTWPYWLFLLAVVIIGKIGDWIIWKIQHIK